MTGTLIATFLHGRSLHEAPPESDVDTGTNVLVVDDDRFVRDLLHRVLTGAGMQVSSYGSAAELLEDADFRLGDVLLLDVSMPEM